MPKKSIEKKKIGLKTFKILFTLTVIYAIIMSFLFLNWFGKCAGAGEGLLSPPKTPIFLMFFIGGFLVLCFVGWYFALRYA